jgi:SAM-dependent methyltransferase
VDPITTQNRIAWEKASKKYVDEYQEFLDEAIAGGYLFDVERQLLGDILRQRPRIVHLQSGHGMEDVALVHTGAASVIGVDFSAVAAGSAQRRAHDIGVDCRYVVAAVPEVPLADGSADLLYTGKGALIWIADLTAWAREVARLLRPGGHLFIYEAHPAVPLWTWDVDQPRIRPDRSYFGRSHVNDSYPANGAVERQWTLGEIVTAIASAGMEIVHLGEYPEPFWRPGDLAAAAWAGRLPNAFSLLARRP